MRLIEADELIKNIAQIDDLRRLSTKTIGQAIHKCKEVKAIPIEWIKKWERKEENYYLYKDMTRNLLEDWEKRSGKNMKKVIKDIYTILIMIVSVISLMVLTEVAWLIVNW